MLIQLATSFNHLPVEVNKVSGTRLLWRNKSATENNEMSDDHFVDSYSWVTTNNIFSDKCKNYQSITQTMFAERYGGFGIGTNGGGARVVNVGGTQIKGVGANNLAGEGALKSHSYGGLDIQGAMKEIIYSRLLNKISPVGAQHINGLILIDKTSALHNGKEAPSVLMVREKVARPSHFLPCLNFRLKPEHRTIMRSDYSRVLGIYKSIGKQGLSEFYTQIQRFLDRSADQLSFFRMARFSHNALTPSNICMDGRVLDTALCSFVISGSNYGHVTSFFEEPSIPALVAKEWFYLIKKFLTETPLEEHFLNLYEDKLYQYSCVNVGFIFGLDREMSTKLSSTPEWQKVSSKLISLLSLGARIKTSVSPSANAADFINDILTASLYSILHNHKTDNAAVFLAEFICDLNSLITIMGPSLSWHSQNLHGFLNTFAIQTIKRAVLSSYFFTTHIGGSVDDYCVTGNIYLTAEIIKEHDHTADWIYENILSERCTIFSGNGVKIEYSSVVDEYLYCGQDGQHKCINDIHVLRYIIDINKNDYTVQNYNFYPYLRRLFALLDGDAINSFSGVRNVFC